MGTLVAILLFWVVVSFVILFISLKDDFKKYK